MFQMFWKEERVTIVTIDMIVTIGILGAIGGLGVFGIIWGIEDLLNPPA